MNIFTECLLISNDASNMPHTHLRIPAPFVRASLVTVKVMRVDLNIARLSEVKMASAGGKGFAGSSFVTKSVVLKLGMRYFHVAS